MESDAPRFRLVMVEGPDAVVNGQEVREYEFQTTRVLIGRIRDATDFQLYSRSEESSVSRFHCVITYDRLLKVFLLTDLESKSGTHLNERRIAPHSPVEIRDGDRITLGNPNKLGAVVDFLMDETEIIRAINDERISKIRDTASRKTGSFAATIGTGGLDMAAFISYDHADKQIMRRVNETLWRPYEISCWTDASLEPGTASWQRHIEENLESIPCLIVLMTPNSKVSEWVAREINYGTRQDCCIFPVLADGEERDAIPLSLANMQYIDIRHDFDQGMRRLAEAVKGHLEAIREDED